MAIRANFCMEPHIFLFCSASNWSAFFVLTCSTPKPSLVCGPDARVANAFSLPLTSSWATRRCSKALGRTAPAHRSPGPAPASAKGLAQREPHATSEPPAQQRETKPPNKKCSGHKGLPQGHGAHARLERGHPILPGTAERLE